MSQIGHLIDRVAREALAAPLKATGYRKDGRTWRLRCGNAIRVVNVQASVTNSAAEGRCTLNAGVYFRSLAECLGVGVLTDAPTESDCLLRCRVAALGPERYDRWWPVGLASSPRELAAAAAEMRTAFEQLGRPWLARLSELREARDEFVRTGQAWCAAAASLVLGERREAARYLQQAADASPTQAAHLRRWGRERGLFEPGGDCTSART